MKRPGDKEDAGTGDELRKALKAKVRHPYITGQGLDAPGQSGESDAHQPADEADMEGGSAPTPAAGAAEVKRDDKEDAEQDGQ